MILYQGDMSSSNNQASGMEKDDFFEKNYPGIKGSLYMSN
jgi:hypothetical protein